MRQYLKIYGNSRDPVLPIFFHWLSLNTILIHFSWNIACMEIFSPFQNKFDRSTGKIRVGFSIISSHYGHMATAFVGHSQYSISYWLGSFTDFSEFDVIWIVFSTYFWIKLNYFFPYICTSFTFVLKVA